MHSVTRRSNNDSPTSVRLRGAKQAARLLVLLAWPTLLVTAIAVSPWVARHWALDLTTHMRAHLMLAAAVLTPLLFSTGRRFLAALCLLAAVANAWAVQPWTFVLPSAPAVDAVPDKAGSTAVLRVLFWNVYLRNDDAASVLRLVAEQDADVVVLLEFSGRLAASLEPLRSSHPHHREIAGTGDAFGLALYSRVAGSISRGRLARSAATLTFRTSPASVPAVQITAVHLYPPVGDAMWRTRDAQLSDLAHELAGNTTLPRIVGGDFNITPWADGYRDFLRTANLIDTRTGFGYMASWPRPWGPVGIPIDQVAVDAAIQVRDRRVFFASPESDHAAVLVVVAVPVGKQ